MPEPPAAIKLGRECGGRGLGAHRGPASEQAVRGGARPVLSAGLEGPAWWPRRPLPGAAGARQAIVPVRSGRASSQGLRVPVGGWVCGASRPAQSREPMSDVRGGRRGRPVDPPSEDTHPKGLLVLLGTGTPFLSRDPSRHAEGWPHAGGGCGSRSVTLVGGRRRGHGLWGGLWHCPPRLQTGAGIPASSPSLPTPSSPAHLQDDLSATKLLPAESVLVNGWTGPGCQSVRGCSATGAVSSEHRLGSGAERSSEQDAKRAATRTSELCAQRARSGQAGVGVVHVNTETSETQHSDWLRG